MLFKGLVAALKKICVLESFSHDYNISELLGTGHFASVYLVSHKESGEKFAAKVIKKNSEEFVKNKVIFFSVKFNACFFSRVLLSKKSKY